jgi:nucleoside-diphosphate-sugar epimerase
MDVRKAAERLSFRTRYQLQQAMQETISWYRVARWV